MEGPIKQKERNVKRNELESKTKRIFTPYSGPSGKSEGFLSLINVFFPHRIFAVELRNDIVDVAFPGSLFLDLHNCSANFPNVVLENFLFRK